MTIPAHRLKIIDLVSTTVRSVASVVDLEAPSAAAAGASPAMLLQDLQRIEFVHFADQRSECQIFCGVFSQEHEFIAVERTKGDLPTTAGDRADFVSD
jgi:hypothetical protein